MHKFVRDVSLVAFIIIYFRGDEPVFFLHFRVKVIFTQLVFNMVKI